MAYTPPPGNAANFIFGTGGYVPPTGTAVNFVFGGSIPPPPPGTTLLPFMASRGRDEADDIGPPAPRFSFIPSAAPALVTPYPPNRWMTDEAEVMVPTRRVFTFMPFNDEVIVTLFF